MGWIGGCRRRRRTPKLEDRVHVISHRNHHPHLRGVRAPDSPELTQMQLGVLSSVARDVLVCASLCVAAAYMGAYTHWML